MELGVGGAIDYGPSVQETTDDSRIDQLPCNRQLEIVNGIPEMYPQGQLNIIRGLPNLPSSVQCEIMHQIPNLSPWTYSELVEKLPEVSEAAQQECRQQLSAFPPTYQYHIRKIVPDSQTSEMQPEDHLRKIQLVVQLPGGLKETELDITVALFDTGAPFCTVSFPWLGPALEKKGWTAEEVRTLLDLEAAQMPTSKTTSRLMQRLGIKSKYPEIQSAEAVNGTKISVVAKGKFRFCIQDKPCSGKRVFPKNLKNQEYEFSVVEGRLSHDVIFSSQATEDLGLWKPSINAFLPVPPHNSKEKSAADYAKHKAEKKRQAKLQAEQEKRKKETESQSQRNSTSRSSGQRN